MSEPKIVATSRDGEPAPIAGAVVTINQIGELPSLTDVEHLALTVGLQQVGRGEPPTNAVATQCIYTLARLAGIALPTDHPDLT